MRCNKYLVEMSELAQIESSAHPVHLRSDLTPNCLPPKHFCIVQKHQGLSRYTYDFFFFYLARIVMSWIHKMSEGRT